MIGRLHLADCRTSTEDNSLCSGLPVTLRDLGLDDVQMHFDAARNAFPNAQDILKEVSAGIAILKKSIVPGEYAHKIERKMIHAARVIRIAAGVELDATLSRTLLENGDSTTIDIVLEADIEGVETRVSFA